MVDAIVQERLTSLKNKINSKNQDLTESIHFYNNTLLPVIKQIVAKISKEGIEGLILQEKQNHCRIYFNNRCHKILTTLTGPEMLFIPTNNAEILVKHSTRWNDNEKTLRHEGENKLKFIHGNFDIKEIVVLIMEFVEAAELFFIDLKHQSDPF